MAIIHCTKGTWKPQKKQWAKKGWPCNLAEAFFFLFKGYEEKRKEVEGIRKFLRIGIWSLICIKTTFLSHP